MSAKCLNVAQTSSQKRRAMVWAKNCYIQGLLPATKDHPAIHAPTLQMLAQRLNLSLSSLERRSSKENWVEEKNAYARKAVEAEQEQMRAMFSQQHIKARVSCFRSAMRILALIDSQLVQRDTSLSMSELLAAARALAYAQAVTEVAMGCGHQLAK